jgi:beta-phosphoglucomutase-like phosphatase (HAD superfamily)
VTRTAELHAAAWAALSAEFLSRRPGPDGEPFRLFDSSTDYLAYVDGKPRYEGRRSFPAARGIVLPEGAPTDGVEAPTVHGLGGRKDALFMDRLRREGVEVFASTVDMIHALRGSSRSSSRTRCLTVVPRSPGASPTSRCAAVTSPPSCSG